MIEFDIDIFLLSTVSALIFGGLFSFCRFLCQLVMQSMRLFFSASALVKNNDNAVKQKSESVLLQLYQTTSLGTFTAIVLFGLCFMVLSYVFLDGRLRLFLFLLSLIGYYLADNTIVKILKSAVSRALEGLLAAIANVLCKIVDATKRAKKRVKRKNGYKKKNRNKSSP